MENENTIHKDTNENKTEENKSQKIYSYDEIKDNVGDPRLKRRPKSQKNTKPVITNVYAGFWVRMFAFLFDAFLVNGVLSIINYYINPQLPIKDSFLFVTIFAIYSFICTVITKGYTAGKYLLGIKVVSDKSNLNTVTILVRELFGKIILVAYKILFIFVPFSDKKHSIIDFFTDTSVIKVKFEEEFKNIEMENYQ